MEKWYLADLSLCEKAWLNQHLRKWNPGWILYWIENGPFAKIVQNGHWLASKMKIITQEWW